MVKDTFGCLNYKVIFLQISMNHMLNVRKNVMFNILKHIVYSLFSSFKNNFYVYNGLEVETSD